MGEVRKLQKKLRQIEDLEIKADLTPEERVKVSKKVELRTRLAELLHHSGSQQTQCIVGEEEGNMKRQVSCVCGRREEGAEACLADPPMAKAAREDEVKDEGRGETHHLPATAASTDPDAEFRALKASWEKVKFRLRTLEGHSDIITCVAAVDNFVISGSRDTTVKVWHVPTATEQHNLGGHRGGVTCLSVPPAEYCRRLATVLRLADGERLVLSGSADCCMRTWTLSSGQCVRSVYTFNAVASLCFVAEGEGYAVTGSDAGKLQVWGWRDQENCQSVNAHSDAVDALQSQGPLLFSGSTDGSICVWEMQHQGAEPLRPLRRWGPEVTCCVGGGDVGGRLRLSARGDRVFLACGRATIRVLDWQTGTVRRLTNHSSTAGVTDCVNQIPGVLSGSCFDLTTGESTLNLFSLPECRYLISLSSSDLPRIFCFAAWLTPSGGHRWVTGGRELIVWEQLPDNAKRVDVSVRCDSRLDGLLADSDRDSSEESENDGEDHNPKHSSDTEEAAGSSWLRCVLQ
ncbi:F-box/WD repeat-containing protein 7 isoform X2 [Electrophorus electricus]|uniref:F-box/WD repeat-containing protein 7 isoform X2 n=1 Tax=Electrophorus electricus TaxID=8005 RepID=UPI0015D0ACDA|nr:F-box/WD repeat-containing protein 7 isoform X2 [Electrophorus electricus]